MRFYFPGWVWVGPKKPTHVAAPSLRGMSDSVRFAAARSSVGRGVLQRYEAKMVHNFTRVKSGSARLGYSKGAQWGRCSS